MYSSPVIRNGINDQSGKISSTTILYLNVSNHSHFLNTRRSYQDQSQGEEKIIAYTMEETIFNTITKILLTIGNKLPTIGNKLPRIGNKLPTIGNKLPTIQNKLPRIENK